MKPRGGATGPARWQPTAVACGIALLTAACSSGSSTAPGGSSSSAATSSSVSAASSALCTDAAGLRASLKTLTQVQTSAGQGVVHEVKTDLANVKTAVTKFASDAKGRWHSQTSGLRSALTSLGTAIQQLAANPSTAGVSTVVSALGQVTTSAQQLFAAVGKDCPGT